MAQKGIKAKNKSNKLMRVLHTADWHLGKRLDMSERTEEHQLFLDWLIVKITEASIDVLIVAGDIFDTGSPSNTALKLYYDFLQRLKGTCCREVIIIGGNHDSVSTLNAPKELLKHFNVNVIGGVPENFEEQIIPIQFNGVTELVVCAVPFLRDRDVRLSVSGESGEEMETRLIQGICDHYNRLVQHILPFKASGILVMATGHLFAQGASTSDSEQKIHVGNLAQIGANQFPTEFNYVALGHLHRPQMVNGKKHIRYSGSPIPLSFSESEDQKKVVILTCSEGKLSEVEEVPVPQARKLLRVSGTIEEVKKKLQDLPDERLELGSWVEVQVTTPSCIPNLEQELEELTRDKKHIERLFIRQVKERPELENTYGEEVLTLFDLSPNEVFEKCCQNELGDTDFTELKQTFDLALELMQQQEEVPVL